MRVKPAYTLGIGAAAMFLLDPDRGRRRRAWLRDKCVSACRKTERAYETTRRDFRNRSKGVWARTTALFRRSDVSDITCLKECARKSDDSCRNLTTLTWKSMIGELACQERCRLAKPKESIRCRAGAWNSGRATSVRRSGYIDRGCAQ
jgi:hypothetical protein